MRYIRKINDAVIEYAGPSLGGDKWYTEKGWTPYSGSLPVSRLDIGEDGAIIELPPPEPPPILISKLKLKRKLDTLGQWESFKTALESFGLREDFEFAANLSTGDSAFQAALANLTGLTEGLGVTMTELLAECIWEE